MPQLAPSIWSKGKSKLQLISSFNYSHMPLKEGLKSSEPIWDLDIRTCSASSGLQFKQAACINSGQLLDFILATRNWVNTFSSPVLFDKACKLVPWFRPLRLVHCLMHCLFCLALCASHSYYFWLVPTSKTLYLVHQLQFFYYFFSMEHVFFVCFSVKSIWWNLYSIRQSSVL